MKERLSYSRLLLSCTILCVMAACAQTQSNDIVAEGEEPVRVSDSYSFTEGPAADARGDDEACMRGWEGSFERCALDGKRVDYDGE